MITLVKPRLVGEQLPLAEVAGAGTGPGLSAEVALEDELLRAVDSFEGEERR